jgi:hypothetical protein
MAHPESVLVVAARRARALLEDCCALGCNLSPSGEIAPTEKQIILERAREMLGRSFADARVNMATKELELVEMRRVVITGRVSLRHGSRGEPEGCVVEGEGPDDGRIILDVNGSGLEEYLGQKVELELTIKGRP